MSLVEAGPLAQVLEVRRHASTASCRACASVFDQATGEVVSLLGSIAAQRLSWAAPCGKLALVIAIASKPTMANEDTRMG
jgi:hypothetical protein